MSIRDLSTEIHRAMDEVLPAALAPGVLADRDAVDGRVLKGAKRVLAILIQDPKMRSLAAGFVSVIREGITRYRQSHKTVLVAAPGEVREIPPGDLVAFFRRIVGRVLSIMERSIAPQAPAIEEPRRVPVPRPAPLELDLELAT